MPTSFLCGIHLPGTVDKAAAARRLGGCLPVMNSHGLEPLDFAEAAWRDESPRLFGGTSLIHRGFASRTGDPLWGAGFMIVPAPDAAATVITMMTPGDAAGDPDETWHWLTALSEDLCDAIEADLGLINGFTIRRDGSGVGSTPAGPDVAPGHPPRVLLPWMWWGPSRLAENEIVDGLRPLAEAAFRSSPSPRGGWVLQAHKDYSATEPKRLLAAYAANFHVTPPKWYAVK